MHNEEYTQMSSMIRAISGKTVKDIQEEVQVESTKAYGDTLKQIAKDRQLKNLTKKDRDTLVKIAKLLGQDKKEDIDEALNRRERAEAKSLIKQANTYYRNMDKVEKFAFKNSRDLSKVERSLGGMIADLKRSFSMDSRFVNRQIEKLVGADRFFNFSEFADDAYEGMTSAEAAFEEHIRQLKDNDPDAQETLDIFLDKLESANRSYGEFLRSAVLALEDSLDEDLDETDTVAGDIALKDMPLGKKKDDEEEVNEAVEPGPIDPRTLAGKIITGEVKLLTVKQGSPGRRGTSIMATGKPSVMGAPPDSIYIDATGNRPRGSGLAIGFRLSEVKKAEIKRDGSARVELK